jgi:hypothetical protein
MIWNNAHESVHPNGRLAGIVWWRVDQALLCWGAGWRLDTFGTVAPLFSTTSFRLTRADKLTEGSGCPLRPRLGCCCG